MHPTAGTLLVTCLRRAARQVMSGVRLLHMGQCYKKESSQSAIALCLLIANLLSVGCHSSATAPRAAAGESMPQAQPSASPQVLDPTEGRSEALREVWRRFTASGQYRLAQKEEMHVPLAEIPYVYIWGDLAYGKRADADHLAVIVVDTTRNDDNRFGLVILSPPEGRRDYKVHWLYRDRDLSKTSVHIASGSFFVTEQLDDGSERTCMVHWYRSQNQFQCKQP